MIFGISWPFRDLALIFDWFLKPILDFFFRGHLLSQWSKQELVLLFFTRTQVQTKRCVSLFVYQTFRGFGFAAVHLLRMFPSGRRSFVTCFVAKIPNISRKSEDVVLFVFSQKPNSMFCLFLKQLSKNGGVFLQTV